MNLKSKLGRHQEAPNQKNERKLLQAALNQKRDERHLRVALIRNRNLNPQLKRDPPHPRRLDQILNQKQPPSPGPPLPHKVQPAPLALVRMKLLQNKTVPVTRLLNDNRKVLPLRNNPLGHMIEDPVREGHVIAL